MAKHRTQRQQRARKAMLASAATAGMAGALAIVQGTNAVDMLVQLTATQTYIGIGGQGNPTSDRVPDKLNGTLVPHPVTTPPYVPILYPASLELGKSRDVGVPLLDDAINNSINGPGDKVSVIGYSEGTLVAEAERRKLEADPSQAPTHDQLTFTQVASPFAGNGGLFARFPQVPTFIIVDNMGPGQPTRYDTHYYVNEYDPYGDFPAYFNPLALANSALAVEYAHPDQYYDDKNPTVGPGASPQLGETRTVQHTEADGTVVTDTYTVFYTDELPLLAPIRQAADAASLGAYVEPGLDLVEPSLRVLIDMGYTDRTNANPAEPTPFKLITPPANIIGAAQALPAAIQLGIADAKADTQAIGPLNTPSPLNRSNAPAATSLPVTTPKLPALPTLDKPKVDVPKPELDKPKVDVPKPDAIKLPKLPVLARSNAQRSTFGPLSNLVPKPTVVAGDAPPSGKPALPSFGGVKPAGVLHDVVGRLTKGLTDHPPASGE